MRKRSKILGIISSFSYDFPCPINLNFMWNFGSLLGVTLVFQILTGFLLSFHYVPVAELAFGRIAHIERDVNQGWLLRSCHQSGASFLMMCLVAHMARGIYYDSYDRTPKVWYSGCGLYVLTMAVSFLGYVLPWGQMSYWGATVITNLFSVIPLIGNDIVRLAWGGYSVGDATLNRFYSFHFILPFLMIPLVGLHLYYLHIMGSSNPLGVDSRSLMVPFYPYYFYGDLLGMIVGASVFSFLVLGEPYLLLDPLNYEEANPMVTPLHIKPEWYFLPYYSLLRSVPSKCGGIAVMVLYLLDLIMLPSYSDKSVLGVMNCPGRRFLFWLNFNCLLMSGWFGAQPAEEPYLVMSCLCGLVGAIAVVLDGVIGDYSNWYEE